MFLVIQVQFQIEHKINVTFFIIWKYESIIALEIATTIWATLVDAIDENIFIIVLSIVVCKKNQDIKLPETH
jgi:hypothetical protein